MRLLWVLGLLAIMALAQVGTLHASPKHPVAFAISIAPWFALATFLVLTVLAGRASRKVVWRDAGRIACWTLFAFGLGVRWAPYYPKLLPQHFGTLRLASTIIIAISLLGVAGISFFGRNSGATPEN